MSALSKWCVVYGDHGLIFYCQAEGRKHAAEQCESAYPDDTVHVAVPCNPAGTLVLEIQSEDPTTCPKCGRRTEFETLPFRSWQIHVCHRCTYSFIAVPDEDDSLPMTALRAQFLWTKRNALGSAAITPEEDAYVKKIQSGLPDNPSWADALLLIAEGFVGPGQEIGMEVLWLDGRPVEQTKVYLGQARSGESAMDRAKRHLKKRSTPETGNGYDLNASLALLITARVEFYPTR